MTKVLLMCAALSVLTSGCANGWPRVRNAPRVAHSNCLPTGSKIDRNDCGTSAPASQTTSGDMDRAQSQQNTGAMNSMARPH
jgi:hypothetical protein